jgi:hypothetical protein
MYKLNVEVIGEYQVKLDVPEYARWGERYIAPAASIICAPRFHTRQMDYGESEYLIDRQKLTSVKLLERFAQRSIDEYTSGCEDVGKLTFRVNKKTLFHDVLPHWMSRDDISY